MTTTATRIAEAALDGLLLSLPDCDEDGLTLIGRETGVSLITWAGGSSAGAMPEHARRNLYQEATTRLAEAGLRCIRDDEDDQPPGGYWPSSFWVKD